MEEELFPFLYPAAAAPAAPPPPPPPTKRTGQTITSPSQLVDRRLQETRRVPTQNIANVSLAALCRNVIVSNLERYPPDAFGVCSEDEFEKLIRIRHEKTQPKSGGAAGGTTTTAIVAGAGAGGGGLDGTGRMAPAVSEKFLKEVEDCNPHLSESAVSDLLVWKDCVEYRFRRGGLARPRALVAPWPALVGQVSGAADALLRGGIDADGAQRHVDVLVRAPMSVALLKATGAGKTVKKALKAASSNREGVRRTDRYDTLDRLLTAWMELAAQSGVEMTTAKKPPSPPPSKSLAAGSSSSPSSVAVTSPPSFQEDAADLKVAENCKDWRSLFDALKQREELRRSKQGKRMRETRKKLASVRPKVVKVRPTPAKYSKILSRPDERKKASWGGGGGSQQQQQYSSQQGNKMAQLRHEAAVVATRQRTDPSKPTKRAAGFGAAVAFASSSKQRGATKSSPVQSTTQVNLSGKKIMKVPNKVVRGSSGVPRQLASKWKKVNTPGNRRRT